jgi:hypothetical protein
MSIHIPENFYRQTITRAVTLTTGVNIYVSAHPTPSEGYIAISPASTNLREIVYYTAKGTDGNGTYLTVTTANRGLGGTTAQTHAIGEPVRMNVSAETIQEISDAIDQIVAGGAQNASTTVKGIAKLSVAPASATDPIAVGDNDPRLTPLTAIKFGGTGADGALTITSGATNIDLGNAAVVIKNYSSISITGTGSLTFTNPHTNGTTIILKSQGDVTLTSSAAPMINASGMGGAKVVGGSGGSGTFTDGSAGNNGKSIGLTPISNGGGAGATGIAGPAGAKSSVDLSLTQLNSLLLAKYPRAFIGAAGGTGSRQRLTGTTGNFTAGDSGAGGGCLIIECRGALNFTTTNGISVAGLLATPNGSQGTSDGNGFGSAGGGGSGGYFLCSYNSLTANTGSVTVTGGTGGNHFAVGGGSSGNSGGGGGNQLSAGNAGLFGSSTNGSKTGGDGASGVAEFIQNTEFA